MVRPYQYQLPSLPPPPAGLPVAPPSPALPADHSDWRQEPIYFPFTDRFSNGDTSNDWGVDPGRLTAFHGGDMKGIISKLDYIKSLGCNTVWLSPLQQNSFEGYHGYWINDYEKVEPHQGDLATAKELVQKAHEKGMKVVLDTVLNHVGQDHPWLQDPHKRDTWFHHNGTITDYNDPWQLENKDLAGLPDLNQENPEVFNYLLNNTADWVKELGADGVRLDAVKHVSKSFWSQFVPALKDKVGKPDFMVLGEVFHGDAGYLADYQKAGVDYLFDVPLSFTTSEVFGKGSSCRYLAQRLAEDSKYPHPEKLVTLLDNHDFPRFMASAKGSLEEKVERLELATAFLMTVRGIPSVYYGTECAMEGGQDPDNRRDMDFERRPDVRQRFSQLAHLHENHEALRQGQQLEMWQDDQVYAFARRTQKEEVVSAFNPSDTSVTRQIPLREGSLLHEGQELRDELSGRRIRVQDGKLHIELAPRSACILTA